MRNKDIKKVLVIGSGPIIIGQAAEFDYSGTQACETLKKEGLEVVLINSNPATIMTDTTVADRIYIEPINVDFIEKIIKKEKPDSILPGMGGQTGLNIAVELYEKGILDKYNVKVIGTPIEAIKRGEDRKLFCDAMRKINEPILESKIVENLEDGYRVATEIGYPVVVRPAYTLGGTGGGFANNPKELEEILSKGLLLSRVGQALIERSILGWKEIEYEVIRDSDGNTITVCNMENVDPVGIHTGDSIVVAPSQTLTDVEYQLLRTASIKIVNEIGVIGGCNVQFALNPKSFEYAIIEVNPRVSRSSALASKATGYPIARVATRLSLGYLLDEVKNEVTEKTYACFEPTLDYIVVKIPKWPFDKFEKANKRLGTKMMATGEVMAIGNNFEAALLKGIRSLEIGRYGLEHPSVKKMSMIQLKDEVVKAEDIRIFIVAEMLRRGYIKEKLQKLTGIDKFFMEKIEWIVKQEEILKNMKFSELDDEYLIKLKKKGFADRCIAGYVDVKEEDIYKKRIDANITPVYKMVDTCAGEFAADSSYYYSTYDQFDEVDVSDKRKIVVIGSGPIRIGQGIEFDYCTVHAVKTLKKLGIESIIINNNPETVSTDFSTADKLYFEPLVTEDIMSILEKEKPEGVILQFGGQTAIKLAKDLYDRGVNIIGTSADKIDEAEDRERFEEMMEELDIKRPNGKGVWNVEDGIRIADIIEYPVLVRPSYVLGGQGMEICYDEKNLVKYLVASFERDPQNPVLIDKYLNGIELEVDAVCDGEDILIPGVMEHLERAGVHSGDSITIYPPQNLYEGTEDKILSITKKIAKALQIKGMMNIQFIAYQNELYVIEVNPRSSRTVPYISKVSGVPIVEIALRVTLGEKLKDMNYGTMIYKKPKLIAVKVPVFSTEKLSRVEVALGPEMRSTGEVLGIGYNVYEAIFKGLMGAQRVYQTMGKKVLVTIGDTDKEEFLPIAKDLICHGSELYATEGTKKFLKNHGIESELVNRIGEESPNISDMIKTRKINLIINTPTKAGDSQRDGFKMRRIAIEHGVDVLTCFDTIKSILKIQDKHIDVINLDVFDISKI
ncbi:MAG: carbamoyl-phosphate synthase large subunit [Fusobacteriaceae bacterium]|jgi:carbamoyl-phosphate synthase large subunit|nr:carbamoyl-phosphate synthase large subunit [Fusobacteriaceae bacterium]